MLPFGAICSKDHQTPSEHIRADYMRRRDFMRVMVVGAAGWPLSIRAAQPAQGPLIGVLFAARADDPLSSGSRPRSLG